MIIGAVPPLFDSDRKPERKALDLAAIPPVAFMVVPGTVLYLVDRKKHPIIWGLFGAFPMASATMRAIALKRLF